MNNYISSVLSLFILFMTTSLAVAADTGRQPDVAGFLSGIETGETPLPTESSLLKVKHHLCLGDTEGVPVSVKLPSDTQEFRLYDISAPRKLVYRIIPGKQRLLQYETRMKIPETTTLVLLLKKGNAWHYEKQSVRVFRCCYTDIP